MQCHIISAQQTTPASHRRWPRRRSWCSSCRSTSRPPGCNAEEHGALALAVARLLGCVCMEASRETHMRVEVASEQLRRAVAQLLPALSGLPRLLRLATGGRPAAEAGDEQLLSLVVALSCTNHQLHFLWEAWEHASEQQARPVSASLADVAVFCSAACGALECIPLVQQLHDMNLQQPRSWASQLAAFSAGFVSTAVDARTAVCEVLWASISAREHGQAANKSADAAVWQLHSKLARLVHFTAATDSPVVLMENEAAIIVCSLGDCLAAAAHLHFIAVEHSQARSGSLAQRNR